MKSPMFFLLVILRPRRMLLLERTPGSKVPKCRVSMASVLGAAIRPWGIYSINGTGFDVPSAAWRLQEPEEA